MCNCIVLIYYFNHIFAKIIHVLITFKCILLQTSLTPIVRGTPKEDSVSFKDDNYTLN